MITCDFSKRGNSSLCDFLIETIKSRIMDGTLKANEKLPSKRTLASHLGVSVITVQNAYAELISNGYIFSVEKKGFFVTDLPVTETEHIRKTGCKINYEERKKEESVFVDLKSNSIGWEKFPFSIWSRITRNVLNSPHENLLKSQPVQGTFILREAISKHLKNFRNMDVAPEQIVIGAGSEVLYSLIVRLLGIKKRYGVENPGYKKISEVLEMNGAKVIHIPIDGNGLSVNALKKSKVSVVHVTPSHHFPTGIVMPIKRRMELLSWAKEDMENRFIIEDDYDSEFRFNGKPIPPLQSASSELNVIYINTFSKTLSPSFRISYMVLPQRLLKLFNERLFFYSCTVSSFDQYILTSFMEEGHYSKHIIRMKNYYRNLRNELIYKIENSPLKEFVRIHEENSGLHFLLVIKSRTSGEKIKSGLEKRGIKTALLKDFFFEPDDCVLHISSDGHEIPAGKTFVINYSGIEKEKIPETVARILESVSQNKSQPRNTISPL